MTTQPESPPVRDAAAVVADLERVIADLRGISAELARELQILRGAR